MRNAKTEHRRVTREVDTKHSGMIYCASVNPLRSYWRECTMEKTLPTKAAPDADKLAVDDSKANDPKKGHLSQVLTEGLVLLLVTAGAYFGTYIYEFGYARELNIPTEFITLSIQNLLYCG